MLLILILKLVINVELGYNYDKLLYIIAEKESKFQCHVVDPYNITYGKYQVTPHLIQKLGYTQPMSCEKQDEMMRKLVKMYEEMLNVKKYEFKYHKGVLLHRTNLLIAMHFAPYGTIRYLETGVDFGNGLVSVSQLLKRYEHTSFYELQ
ncbi:MAG: hypothetical protein MUE85_11960 [Microscillaceae bacterium]|jgi:hypothetical protein|nr:hypothetical protein [Microscillaceae bacterium]